MRSAVRGAALAAASLLVASPAYADNAARPAGGAATGEIVLATVVASIATIAVLLAGLAHRSGRLRALGRAAAWSERHAGLPGWAALPILTATASLITALVGMYWDIALHIDVGRDEGPLANPAHYLILAGLFGVFTAGFLAMALPRDRPSASAIRLSPDWHAPLGGVLICACGAFSLTGFPLDDAWHRLFGQDVTLWGPTHLMLIGGAAMTLIGIAVLNVEGRRARAAAGHPGGEHRRLGRIRLVSLMGGLLLGLSTFQAEFDFGVPQFRFVFHPLLVMLAAGVGLVAARLSGGPGVAIGAVGFFLVARGLLSLLVGPVLGQTTPHLPLYVVEALVVEAVAWRLGTRRPLAVGVVSGLGIGTLGLAAEWAWSHVWMPLPWPAGLLPEAALLGLAGALAGSVLGAWIAHRLAEDPSPGAPALRRAAVVAAAVVAVSVGVALHKPADEGVRAQVALSDVRSQPRTVHADIAVRPASAAQDAEWLTVTAWQGGGLVIDRLRRVAPGRYRTTKPVPVHGTWKALIRLHTGSALMAVPVFLPEDPAIPAEAVPADRRFTRAFVPDHEILQRESRPAAGWLIATAYGVVAAIALSLLALLAWGLHRLGRAGSPPEGRIRWTPAGSRRIVAS